MNVYCFEEDKDFVNYLFLKDNNEYTLSEGPSDATLILHTPYPWAFSWEQRVEQALQQKPNRVIVFATELHSSTVEWIKRYPNFEYYLAGDVDFELKHKHYYMDWFAITRDFYKPRTHILEDIHNNSTNEYKYNALLGRLKPHRTGIYSHILHDPNGIITYLHTHRDISNHVTDPGQFIWEGKPQTVNWTIDQVEYDGEMVSLSQVIPVDVYKQTEWCVVAETNYHEGYVFFTEKIAKPILAKKPFVIVGNPGSLALLHKLGFKTFDTIIDESYDSILTLNTRIEKIAQLMKQLPTGGYQEIVDHNYDVMMSTDWQHVNIIGANIF